MKRRPTKEHLVELFTRKNGYRPNLNPPQTLNEKLLYRKMYRAGSQTPLIIGLTDKIRARLYVEQYIEEEGTQRFPQIKLIPYYIASRDDPPKLYPVVLKPNNKSGQTKIIRRRKDWKPAFDRLMRLREVDYGWDKGEWNYAEVEMEMFREKFIPDFQEFHLYSFSGKVGMVLVVDKYEQLPDHPTSRGPNGMSLFNSLGIRFDAHIEGRPVTHKTIPCQIHIWEKMVHAAKCLSKPLSFVRIDFLVTPDNEIYFSEFTFFPASGNYQWRPREFDTYLGGLWK